MGCAFVTKIAYILYNEQINKNNKDVTYVSMSTYNITS